MIGFSLDTDLGILYLRPTPPLTSGDFEQLTQAVDPWIADNGKLNALIIDHKLIRKIALITDSEAGEIAENFASHSVAAEIEHFAAGEQEEAKQCAMR